MSDQVHQTSSSPESAGSRESAAQAAVSAPKATDAEKPKKPITGFTLAQLTEAFREMGKESYRAKQVFQWIYQKRATSFAEMTNISKDMRAHLEENYSIPQPALVTTQTSEEDGAQKFLFRMTDEKTVETVLIPGADRLTQCVSSQVGCAMACRFCNTGDMGLMRNLKTHEIVDQVLQAARELDYDYEGALGHRLSNIVFMGMGEPFHNFEAMIDAVDILTNDFGLGLSGRRITVSTSGLVDKIAEFGERTNANLAISLNATTDEMRSEIMPINKKWNLESLMEACRTYPMSPRRRITFEYVMLGGLNDTIDDAKRMIKLLQGVAAKINLIPYNPHPASPYRRPKLETVYKMQRYLLDRGMNCTVRISKGKDILAACGQLRSKEAEKRLHRRYFEKRASVNQATAG